MDISSIVAEKLSPIVPDEEEQKRGFVDGVKDKGRAAEKSILRRIEAESAKALKNNETEKRAIEIIHKELKHRTAGELVGTYGSDKTTLLGEEVCSADVSHVISDSWIEYRECETTLVCEAEILNTPEGENLDEIIEDGAELDIAIATTPYYYDDIAEAGEISIDHASFAILRRNSNEE